MVPIGAWNREKSLLEWMSLKIQKLKYTNTHTQQAQIHKNIRGWYREKCWLERKNSSIGSAQSKARRVPLSIFRYKYMRYMYVAGLSIQIHQTYIERRSSYDVLQNVRARHPVTESNT